LETTTLIALLAFASACLAVLGVWTSLQSRAAVRLQNLKTPEPAPSARAKGSLLVASDHGPWAVLTRLGQRAPGSNDSRLRVRLTHAGYRRPSAVSTYYGVRLTLAVGMPFVAAGMPLLWGLPFATLTLILCALAGVGYVGPSAWLDRAVKRRMGEIERALPDALDLMVVCVEAGFGINQALARVAQEFAPKSPVLSNELTLVNNETRAGKSLTAALRGLSDRTGVSDVSALVALLVQTEKFGTSVADALRVHAEAMRIRRMNRAEERAQTAPLKLILPSTMIFAALLILFLTPALLRIYAVYNQ
jgi:tight adherence protein C